MESKKIKLTKIKELPDAEYPNNIQEGETREGHMTDLPKFGDRFTMAVYKKNGIKQTIGSWFSTSPVTEVVSNTKDEIVFKTLNSIYKVELI
jgi:hypothetical protein